MLKYLNITIVAIIAVMIFLTWGTLAFWGWFVALMGWAPWMFESLGERRGNS
jgi:hypothetical protein